MPAESWRDLHAIDAVDRIYAEILALTDEVPLLPGLDSVGEESQAVPYVFGQEDAAQAEAPGLHVHKVVEGRGARRCRSIHQDRWADTRAVFSRWSTYAFDQIRWRYMTVLGTRRVRLKFLQKMFSVLKSEAGFGVIAGRTPWVRRIDADLGVCSLYFVAPRRKTDLLNNLRKSNAVHRKAVADGARNGPTFKKFMDSVGGAAMARLYSEQAMLLKAFELKGDLRYKDVDVDIQSPPDADTEASEFKDTVCPPGVRVCAVRVIAKRNWGVLGVGTELEGDGDKIDRPFGVVATAASSRRALFQLGEFEHIARSPWSAWKSKFRVPPRHRRDVSSNCVWSMAWRTAIDHVVG